MLLDQHGNPFTAEAYKKAAPPKTGEQFGQWAGRNINFGAMPGGGLVQFDLDKLTLQDYRAMTTHYQVNSSLSVLSFMQHQSNWTIECDDKKIANFCTEVLGDIWTQLNRSLSQANWAGYSPNVLQWENEVGSGRVILGKIKDLIPEECWVNWAEVDGYHLPGDVPPKIKIFDGIKQFGWKDHIPVENSLWYPILMENGNYAGRKLLKSAYTSYFFSMLMHLFSNRYYERFGEPTPIGRAPDDDIITLADNTEMRGSDYMAYQIQQLRNRSTVVLPSTREMDQNGRGSYDYDLQYLESQMRGADFERYMQRLDEEISLAIFTPVLLMKTADVGSYNLGVGHMQMYLWMLNALNADRAQYINKYILKPLMMYNFSSNSPIPKIKFNKLDNTNATMIQTLLQALIGKDQVKFDLEQLGEMAGLTLKEVKQTVAPTDPAADPSAAPVDTPASTPSNNSIGIVRAEVLRRVTSQVENAFRDNRFNRDFRVNMGYRRRMEQALVVSGTRDADEVTDRMYARLDAWSQDMADLGTSYMTSANRFVSEFTKLLDEEIGRVS